VKWSEESGYVGFEGTRETTFKGIGKEQEVWMRTGLIWFRSGVTGGVAVDKAMKFRVP